MSKVTTEIVTITPGRAELWLQRNPKNRNLSKRAVENLAAAITRGEWSLNGASIVFDADGNLLDGQHRLAAIVLAGKEVESVVTWGVDPHAQTTMDFGGGGRRSLSDQLTMRGESHSTKLAAALAHLYRFETGRIRDQSVAPTIIQGLELLDQHPNLRASIQFGVAANYALKVNPSLTGYLHYRLSLIDPIDADDFFNKLISGEDLHRGDPIHTLRAALVRDATALKRLPQIHIHAYFIKAWNAYKLGEELRLLRWRAGGAKPEPFPEAI